MLVANRKKKCANIPLQVEYVYYKKPSRSPMQMYKHISGTQTWQIKNMHDLNPATCEWCFMSMISRLMSNTVSPVAVLGEITE